MIIDNLLSSFNYNANCLPSFNLFKLIKIINNWLRMFHVFTMTGPKTCPTSLTCPAAPNGEYRIGYPNLGVVFIILGAGPAPG